MDAVSTSRSGRERPTPDHRAPRVGLARRQPTIRTPNPSVDEQAELAHDLAALIQACLIVAVDDGHEIRYAATGGEEVLP